MHIIIPTNGGEAAANALRYALALRSGQSTKFTLMQSFDLPMSVDVPIDNLAAEEALRHGIDAQLAAQCQKLSANHANEPFHFEHEAVAGGLIPAMELMMEQAHVDMIIMGTEGSETALADLVGTNASDVVGNLNLPILVVPLGAAYCGLRQLVLATDNLPMADRAVLAPLVQLADRHRAEVLVLNVLDEGKLSTVNEAVEGLKTDHALSAVNHSFHFTASNNKASAIIDWARGRGVELLSCMPHQRGFWQSLFHHSISRELVMHAPMPVLVLAKG